MEKESKLLVMGMQSHAEGVWLMFNETFSISDKPASEKHWFTWDKIGAALLPDKYCKETDLVELRKIRGEKPPNREERRS